MFYTRYGLYRGSKIKVCPRHVNTGLNESFFNIYQHEKKIFEKKIILGSFTPLFVPKMGFFGVISHFFLFFGDNFGYIWHIYINYALYKSY